MGVKGPSDWSISNIRLILEITSKTCKSWGFSFFLMCVCVCVGFLALHWEPVCCYWPQAGCPEVSAYSLLCSELTRCFDTGAKLNMCLFREATNEVFQKAVLMTEVETERNTYWIETAISLQYSLNTAAPHHSQSNLAFALAVLSVPEQDICLNFVFLNRLFYWNAKKSMLDLLHTVVSTAVEEGFSLAPQCSWTIPTDADGVWGVHHELSALGWGSGSWICIAEALTRACAHSSSSQALSASPPLPPSLLARLWLWPQ